MRLSESDFAHVEEPRFRRLIRFWLDARGGGDVPPMAAIDPSNFPYVLELIWLCAVEENPREFRYRVAGDHIRAAYEASLVGRTVADITGPSVLDRVMDYFNRVVDGPMVVHILGRIYTEEEERPARGERLILPFADPETGRITRILGATVHSWESRGIGPGEVPIRQVRTFNPVDGSPAWCEAWL
jgi:hypothetical protein